MDCIFLRQLRLEQSSQGESIPATLGAARRCIEERNAEVRKLIGADNSMLHGNRPLGMCLWLDDYSAEGRKLRLTWDSVARVQARLGLRRIAAFDVRTWNASKKMTKNCPTWEACDSSRNRTEGDAVSCSEKG